MKKLILSLLLTLVLLSGCIGQRKESDSEVVDCGTVSSFDNEGVQCFNELAMECKPAKLSFVGTTSINYEVKGLKEGLCEWFMEMIMPVPGEEDVRGDMTCLAYMWEMEEPEGGVVGPQRFSELGDRCSGSMLITSPVAETEAPLEDSSDSSGGVEVTIPEPLNFHIFVGGVGGSAKQTKYVTIKNYNPGPHSITFELTFPAEDKFNLFCDAHLRIGSVWMSSSVKGGMSENFGIEAKTLENTNIAYGSSGNECRKSDVTSIPGEYFITLLVKQYKGGGEKEEIATFPVSIKVDDKRT